MAHRLKTPEGKKLYALRKQTPEPVFGIIKSVLGFRQFSAARARQGPRRVEPRDHGLEHQADVRPQTGRQAACRTLLRNAGATDSRFRSGQRTQVPDRPPLSLLLPNNRCRASTANLQSDRLLGDAHISIDAAQSGSPCAQRGEVPRRGGGVMGHTIDVAYDPSVADYRAPPPLRLRRRFDGEGCFQM